MASYKLLVLEGSPLAQKARTSANETLDFLSVRVGANALTIAELSSTAFDFSSKKISNVSDPAAAQDAATKAYVDSVAQGLRPKAAVRAGTLVSGTLASDFENGDIIDGYTLITGDRILIKNQSSAAQNGIYTVNASGAPTRATDMDSLSPIDEINGSYTFIQSGGQAGQGWVETSVVAVLGTDPMTWVYFNAAGTVVGGDMITVTGSTVSVDLAAVSALESTNPGNNAGQLRLKYDDVTIGINGSNQAYVKAGGISNNEVSASAAIAYSKLNLTGSIINADINASAAIAYSKLNLTGSIINADINASAAIAYSKLALSNSIVNADINASAAIAYSKLALSNSIVNADINASAAIAYSKLALSNSIVDADINASAAIAYSKLNLSASIVNADIAAGAAIAYSKLNLSASIVNADVAAGAAIAYSKLALSNSIVAGDLTANSVTKAKLNSDVVSGDILGGLKLDGTNTLVRQDAVSRTNDNAGTISIRQVVYFKSNGNVDLAKADAAGTVNGKLALVLDATIATTASGLVTSRRSAVVGGFSGLTVGADYYISAATAGSITATPPTSVGQFVRKVGEAISATELELNPEFSIELAS